jgi:hypothetical protein
VTAEREGLDAILVMHPEWDLLGLDWQLAHESAGAGPWLLVQLGERSQDGAEAWARHDYAIWKRTGAVHIVDGYGAVVDPPIYPGRRTRDPA